VTTADQFVTRCTQIYVITNAIYDWTLETILCTCLYY